MNIENIDKLIKRLENEVIVVHKNLGNAENLSRLKQVAEKYRGEDELISFEQVAEQIKIEPEEVKIFSGWSGLDRILKGFRLEQVVVVSALTKSGKTSFLMDLTTRIKDFNPLWLPFEESAKELVRKFVERGDPVPHGFTPDVMRRGKLEMMDWIESKIIEGIAKYGSQVVFIDQLDFLISYNSDNRADRIGDIMRSVKSLAKKWNILIFLICHLSKTKMDAMPTIEDLKGSSSIGQEADTVLLLWREMKRERKKIDITNNLIVSVQANRRVGTTGDVRMVYQNGHFLEIEWRDDEESSKYDFENI